jgi:flagellar biosynthetic protein FliR
MLDSINIAVVFSYLLVFCRIGSGVMMLPGLSEAYMSPVARLVIAGGLTFVVTPVIQAALPPMPQSVIMLVLQMGGEIIIGLLIGTIAKIILSATNVAGGIISYQMGLSSAAMFDPSQGAQSTEIGTFLSLLAMVLIFATDLHQVFLTGLVDSYSLFKPAAAIETGNMFELVEDTVSGSFMVGIRFAAPQIIIGLMMSLGAGVMGRLMPQMQVFFVMMPVQLAVGFFIFMITLSGGMMWFMDYYSEVMGNFINLK